MDDRPLLEFAICAIFELDRDAKVRYANPAAAQLLGVSGEALSGSEWNHSGWGITRIEGGSLGQEKNPVTRALNGEIIKGEEYALIRPDGSRAIVSMNLSPLRNGENRITGAVVDLNDITARKEAEAEIRRSRREIEKTENRVKALVGSIDEIVFEFDRWGTYLNIWTSNEDLLKRPREELLGHPVSEILGKRFWKKLRAVFRKVEDTGDPVNFEYPLEVPAGTRWFLARVGRMPLCDGENPTFSFLARDITERKVMEDILRETRGRYEYILDKIRMAAVMLDSSGRLLYVNDYLLELTGWAREEILDRNWFDTFLPREDRDRIRRLFIEILESSTLSTVLEIEILTRNGERRRMRWNNIILRNSLGGTVCWASIAEDVTERRRAEEVLRSSDRMKTEFISTAAHELRTPLTTILGYAEMLSKEKEFRFSPEERKDFLQEILAKGEILARLVDDLLDLSRVESGRPVPMKKRPASLDHILKQEIRNYEIRYPDYTFRLRLDPDCPPEVLIDPERIEQVLENLLSNSVKYSPPGTRISLMEKRFDDRCEISVRDEGIGMTQEEVDRIFDKFYRVDASDRGKPGLGVGMSIVRNIIEAHGGEIRIRSTPAKGTSVSFTIPLSESGENMDST